MNGTVSKFVLCDSGFWISLFEDRKDPGLHRHALDLQKEIEKFHVLVPWPVLYESLSTRMSKRQDWVRRFRTLLKSTGVVFVDDVPYRDRALAAMGESTRALSLVDRVVREVLADHGTRIDFFVTFNPGDFRDACAERRIEMRSVPDRRPVRGRR